MLLTEGLRREELTSPSFCISSSERVYITAIGCEIEFGGARGLQTAGICVEFLAGANLDTDNTEALTRSLDRLLVPFRRSRDRNS